MSGQHLIWGYVPVEGKVCRGEMQGEGRCRFGSGPKGAERQGGFRAIFSFWNRNQHIDPSGDFAPASMGMDVLRFGSFWGACPTWSPSLEAPGELPSPVQMRFMELWVWFYLVWIFRLNWNTHPVSSPPHGQLQEVPPVSSSSGNDTTSQRFPPRLLLFVQNDLTDLGK